MRRFAKAAAATMQSSTDGCMLLTGPSTGASLMPELRPTVFVVDDDVSVREALEALIPTAGWDVRAFASAEAFLAWPPAPQPR